ncbi:hypothetical protein V8B97DRAFT_2003203 [Scleroderma yunnanense]
MNPPPGPYHVYARIGDYPVNTNPAHPPADVVILDHPAIVHLEYGTQPDTYHIKVNDGYVRPGTTPGSHLRSTRDAPVDWIIRPQGGDFYSVQLKSSYQAWTDPGGHPDRNRRLYLSPLGQPTPNSQLFEFRHVYREFEDETNTSV